MAEVKNNKIQHALFTVFMWALGIIMIIPFIMMVAISFRVSGEAYKGLFEKTTFVLTNYQAVLGHKYFFSWYSNSIVTVLITMVLRLAVTLPAAFAFSRLDFKGRRLLMAILVATLMVPGETTMVSRYLFFKKIHLLDSMWVIILPEASEVFYLTMMTEFFTGIPKDFVEASLIDGADYSKILWKIFIPLSIPSITTVCLFSFIYIWNNYLDPFLFITTQAKQLITPAVKFFMDEGGANMPKQLAFATLALFPVIATFAFTQKYFVSNITSSGIKG